MTACVLSYFLFTLCLSLIIFCLSSCNLRPVLYLEILWLFIFLVLYSSFPELIFWALTYSTRGRIQKTLNDISGSLPWFIFLFSRRDGEFLTAIYFHILELSSLWLIILWLIGCLVASGISLQSINDCCIIFISIFYRIHLLSSLISFLSYFLFFNPLSFIPLLSSTSEIIAVERRSVISHFIINYYYGKWRQAVSVLSC